MKFNMQNRAILRNSKQQTVKLTVFERRNDNLRLFSFTLPAKEAGRINIQRIELFSSEELQSPLDLFRQGWYMPSDSSGFYRLQKKQTVPNTNWRLPYLDNFEFLSHSMIVLRQKNICTLLGFTSFAEFHGFFLVSSKTLKLTAWIDTENIKINNEDRFLTEVAVIQDKDFNQCLYKYADFIGKKHNSICPSKTLTGWCDWQYYREDINESEVLKNAYAMNKLKKRGFPLEYIMIDGGWCNYASEWLKPCKKFPSGMKKFCQKIKKLGFQPGLWFAPYLTNEKTEVVKKHPDWFVLDEKSGKPLRRPGSNVGPCYIFDFSVPEALDWLRNIIHVFVSDWGIKYIKLDGPNPGHYRGAKLHNPDWTTIKLMHSAMKVIREECGRNVIVEGEGIYGPSIGLVELQRTTQDAQPYWYNPSSGAPMAKENYKNDLLSSFMHQKLWHVHRENIMLRDFPSPHSFRAAENAQLTEQLLPENELHLQISACSLAGGAMLLTDPVYKLLRNEKLIELTGKFLPHYEARTGARPVDIFNAPLQPSVYYLPVETEWENYFLLGVFNWDDKYRDFTVPLSFLPGGEKWLAAEFWSFCFYGNLEKQLKARDLPPHSCRIFSLRPDRGIPVVIGSSMHITQGAVEFINLQANESELRFVVRHCYQREQKIMVYLPDGFNLKRISSTAINYLPDCRKKNLLIIYFNGKKQTDFILEWKKI